MLLLSVLAMAMIVALDMFGNPQGAVQQQLRTTPKNYADGLTNNGSGQTGLQAN